MNIKDGFKFGVGLWLATMLMGTLWIVITAQIATSILF